MTILFGMPHKATQENRGRNAPVAAESPLSQNDYEAHVEQHLVEPVKWFLEHFSKFASRQFIFRCFSVAPISSSFMRYLDETKTNIGYHIHQPNSYVLAHSRTVREMIAEKDLILNDDEPNGGELVCGEEKFGHWLERFELWRRAVERTFWYTLDKKGRATNYLDTKQKEAARLGTIYRLWTERGFPPIMAGSFLPQLLRRSTRDFNVFLEQSRAPIRRDWRHEALDLWLIEIWPLVVGFNWTYAETWRVACRKFAPTLNTIKKPLETAEAFSNHCKMNGLDLRLGTEAKKRRGRPTSDSMREDKLPRMAHLAQEIDGFKNPGENTTSEKLRCVRLSIGGVNLDQVEAE